MSTKPKRVEQPAEAPRRIRLAPKDRRRELLSAAAVLLTREGVDAVQFADVAAACGVTRQLVYKFFPHRQALIVAVLEDFATDLQQRFGGNIARGFPESVVDATHIFVEAVCDSIEAKGFGPWRLLDAKGPDAEVARRARAIDDRLLAPWHARIAFATGASPREVTALARMIVAAGRAVLELWHDGTLTREEAVRGATRGVSAMLAAFTVKGRD